MIYSYIKTSIRGLLKNRIYAMVNVGGLALGMAACLVIFYYVAYELSYDKFFEESQSIHRFYLERDQQERSRVYFHLAPAFKPALEEVPGVRSAFRMIPLDYQNNSMVYEENGVKNIFQQQGINFADAGIANTLGLKALEGSFSALNEPSKMVISSRVAYKIFGDQQAIGKTVTLTGNVGAHDYEIVGVMKDLPGNTHFEFTVLLSMSTLEIIEERGTTDSWEGWNTKVYVKGDLPGKELEAAIGQSILEKPIFQGDESVWRARLLPVGEHYLTVVKEDGSIDQSAKNLLLGLAFIGVFILVIGWINFINLSTTRAMERAREVGIRKALGSHTYQLRWQFMIESLVINLCAAVLAFTIVQVALPYLRAIANPMTLPVEGQPLFWAVVFTLLTTGSVLAGLYPAFILSSFKPAVVLKGRVSPLGSGRFFRKGLVVFQFVASTCMIIATYVTYEQLMYMKNKDLGVKIDHTLLLDAPPGSLVEENTTFFESVNSFKEEVIQLSGVNQMTASSVVPGEPIGWNAFMKRPGEDDEIRKNIMLIACDRDFAKAYDLELLSGRFYAPGDGTFGKGNFVINEEALGHFGFSSAEEAIGQQLLENDMFPELTIIGVVKNFHQQSLRDRIQPCGFVLSSWSNYYSITLNIDENRSATGRVEQLRSNLREIEQLWAKFFPGAPFDYSFLDQKFDAQYKVDHQFGMIITLFAIIAIVISSMGLLGLASYSIVQRTKEIGIRKVLGASLARVFGLLTQEYLILILVSTLISMPVAFYTMRQWLSNYPYKIDIGWWMLAMPVLLVGGIALLTVGSQALKTANKNPVESLRQE